MKEIEIKNTYLNDGIYYDIELDKLKKEHKDLNIQFNILNNLKSKYAPDLSFEDIHGKSFEEINFRLGNAYVYFLDLLSKFTNSQVFPVNINDKTIWVTYKQVY